MTDWRPAATPEVLQRRARMLADIRAFFAARHVLEVQTPVLSTRGNPDAAIDSLHCEVRVPGVAAEARYYLHTSPEFAMKRLLAAGSGDIYQICPVFRDGEAGRYHNPEFTLLEWYRLGFDYQRLMDEVAALLRRLLGAQLPERRLAYRDAFLEYLGVDPARLDVAALRRLASDRGLDVSGLELDRDAWLNLLMSHCIEPGFPRETLVFVHDWPASQASLARLSADGSAERFELYLNGVELANGFSELRDVDEQRRRFEQDNQRRRASGQPVIPLDEAFLAALEAGLPECAGVAVGVDRLLMLATHGEHLHDVLSFPIA